MYVRTRKIEMHRCPDCGSPHVIRKHGRGSRSKDPDRPRGEPYEPRVWIAADPAPSPIVVVAHDVPRSVEDLDL